MTDLSGQFDISSEADVFQARQRARDVAEAIGLGTTDTTRVVTAVSELARNVLLYAGEGTMTWEPIDDAGRTGLTFVFDDDGPGIGDPTAALNGEYSTSDGMGRGLSGTQSLMNDMEVETGPDTGTTITIRKWR